MTNTPATRLVFPNWLVPVLVFASAAGWLLSLLLPAFSIEPSGEVWHGRRVLFEGLLFGWTCQGWAVYANVFFVVAIVRLLMGKAPVVSAVAVLLLVATLPLFKGVPRDEATGTILAVQNWGAGAAVWLLSLAMILLAIILRAWFGDIREVVPNAL
jgi:hypothetical protein